VELTDSTLVAALAAVTVVAVVAVVVAIVALLGQRRVRAAYRAFAGPQGVRDDVLIALQRHIDEVTALRRDVGDTRRYTDELRRLIGMSISRVATVRYDAFDDMGGRMSFSSALLDEHGNGVVVTAINGRTETRTYAKPVGGGESRHNLSTEELEAIRRAMSGQGGETELSRPPRVRRAS
jgi:hypothetical protein